MPPGDIGFSEVSNEGELFCLFGFGLFGLVVFEVPLYTTHYAKPCVFLSHWTTEVSLTLFIGPSNY